MLTRQTERGIRTRGLLRWSATYHMPAIILVLLLFISLSSCAMPRALVLTATARIDGTDIVVAGTANVPDDALLLCGVREEGSETLIAQDSVSVSDSKYTCSMPLGEASSGLLAVNVTFTMQPGENLSQPQGIIELYGARGEKLTGTQIVDRGEAKIGVVGTTVDYVRPVAHQVMRIDDLSPLDAERALIWYVLVEDQPSPVELSKLADQLIADCKVRFPFNALSLRFYDYPQFVEQYAPYTLGKVDYAPWGDFNKGLMIKAGEYNVMRRTDHLPAKNWSLQLSHDEVQIWEVTEIEYTKRRDLLANPSAGVDMDLLFADTARELGKTVDQVERVYSKFAAWSSLQ